MLYPTHAKLLESNGSNGIHNNGGAAVKAARKQQGKGTETDWGTATKEKERSKAKGKGRNRNKVREGEGKTSFTETN